MILFAAKSYRVNQMRFSKIFNSNMRVKVSKEAKIRNRYNLVPHLTQDPTWESDKNTIKYNTFFG